MGNLLKQSALNSSPNIKYFFLTIFLISLYGKTANAQNSEAVMKKCSQPTYPSSAQIQGVEGSKTV
jgi:hypothetical protein